MKAPAWVTRLIADGIGAAGEATAGTAPRLARIPCPPAPLVDNAHASHTECGLCGFDITCGLHAPDCSKAP